MERVFLDAKDLRLLRELDKDARRSFSAIGRKTGLDKGSVAYRLKRLQEKGVIKGFYAVVDTSCLGYFPVRAYLRFQFLDPRTQKQIRDYFVGLPSSWWVGSARGNWDFAALFWVKSIHEFKRLWDSFLSKYRFYVQASDVKMYTRTFHYPASYVWGARASNQPVQLTGAGMQVTVDGKDLRILDAVSEDGRAGTVELAKKTGLTPVVAKYRLKKLRSEGVIQGFRVMLNHNLLGFTNYKADFYLRDLKRLEELRAFLASMPQTVYFDETIGGADLEAEFFCSSQSGFEEILGRVKTFFPRDVSRIDYLVFPEIYKIKYFPGGAKS